MAVMGTVDVVSSLIIECPGCVLRIVLRSQCVYSMLLYFGKSVYCLIYHQISHHVESTVLYTTE